MIVVLIRSVILYLAVLIALRTMGKGEIAEMNSLDLVITLLIAEVAAIPMQDNQIPILYGIGSITGLVFMQIVISFIGLKSRKARTLFVGSPSILINNGDIDYKALRDERVNIEELLEQLRVQGYFNLRDVQYAILETDGNLSVVPRSTYQSPPTKDFKHLPIPLVLDGKLIKPNLDDINKNIDWLLGSLRNFGIHSISETLVCILDENDKLFVQKKQ